MSRLIRTTVAAFALSTVLAAAADRITGPVDLNRTVPLRGQRHSRAVPRNDLGPADGSAGLSYVTLILQPGPGLDAFLADLQNPPSPNYHRWLTPEQFADRFGLSAGDIGKLTAWLQSEGLQVHDVARGRHWITFSGSIANLARAFHTEFHRYAVKGEVHIANASDPSVPEAFAGVVEGFSGLNDFRPVPLVVGAGAKYTYSGYHYLAPDDFAIIYDVQPLYAAGFYGSAASLAVVGASDIDLADIRQFRQVFGLPANDPGVVLYGADPSHTSAEVEADLDLEWAGAVAPGARIIYVNSASPFTAAQYAIDQDLAPIVTFSFGSCEQDNGSLRSVAQQANAQGITWLASSGDSGAATCDYLYSPTPQASLGPTVSFPASVPEVTAVGGTQFNDADGSYWATGNTANGASALSYIPEQVWNADSTSTLEDAAGGGPSSFFAKPWWQIGTLDDHARDVPDVALSASGHDGYLIITTASRAANSFAVVGGTSASAPSFAGIVALLNQYLLRQGAISQPGLGNINPTLYRLAQSTTDVFHDIITGDNKVPCVQGSPQCVDGWMGYAAGPGYDLATGLGSVDANHLVTEWSSGTASQTAVAANPASVDLGATVTLTATVTGGGQAPPTGVITFVVTDTTLGTATLASSSAGAGATASISVPAWEVVGLPVYALYSGDAVYSGSTAYTIVGLNPVYGHSQVVVSVEPDPVPESPRGYWPVTVTLRELADVATHLTGVTFAGEPVPLSLFGDTNIRPKLTINLIAQPSDIPTVPFDGTFVFTGQDWDGTQWTQQLTVNFTGPPGAYSLPAIGLASAPASVQENAAADPSCQWEQDFTVDEHGGFLVELTGFTVGAVDFTSQIQQIFGTTRMAPYGTLHGSTCWASTNTFAPSSKTFTMTATAPAGFSTSASTTVQYQVAALSPAQFSVSPAEIELTASAGSNAAGAAIDLSFSGGSPSWHTTVLPANSTTGWIKVQPLSGSGSGQLTVLATTTGLSPGTYQASIAVAAPGAVPDHILIPVVLAVGTSAMARITAVANAASYQTTVAPGMLAAVFGVGLSSAAAQAQSIPLPLALGGVSVTVNGVSAPVVGTFPDSDQVNIQIPYEAGSGAAVLAVNNNGQVAYYPLQIAVAAPGLFGILDAGGNPLTSAQQGQVVVAYITGEGDVAPFLATGATPAPGTAVGKLPKPRLPLAVSVGGVTAATPAFWGIPSGDVGATQINFTIPAKAPLGPQPVVVTVGSAASNAVSINVLPAPTP